MKIILRPLLLSFFITVAAAFAVFLTSPLHTATAQAPTGSGRDIPWVDSAEQQAALAPITQLFDGMTKRDAAMIKRPLLSGGTNLYVDEVSSWSAGIWPAPKSFFGL